MTRRIPKCCGRNMKRVSISALHNNGKTHLTPFGWWCPTCQAMVIDNDRSDIQTKQGDDCCGARMERMYISVRRRSGNFNKLIWIGDVCLVCEKVEPTEVDIGDLNI